MLETENESLRERVTNLEKKILEQNDEIVCLRSTLADVLRRLAQLEGSRTLSTPPAKNGLCRGSLFSTELRSLIFKNGKIMAIFVFSRNKKNGISLNCTTAGRLYLTRALYCKLRGQVSLGWPREHCSGTMITLNQSLFSYAN